MLHHPSAATEFLIHPPVVALASSSGAREKSINRVEIFFYRKFIRRNMLSFVNLLSILVKFHQLRQVHTAHTVRPRGVSRELCEPEHYCRRTAHLLRRVASYHLSATCFIRGYKGGRRTQPFPRSDAQYVPSKNEIKCLLHTQVVREASSCRHPHWTERRKDCRSSLSRSSSTSSPRLASPTAIAWRSTSSSPGF